MPAVAPRVEVPSWHRGGSDDGVLPVQVIDGTSALFRVGMAGWISLSPELVDVASTPSMPDVVPSRE